MKKPRKGVGFDISKKLRKLRNEKGMTQADVANEVVKANKWSRMDMMRISLYERGNRAQVNSVRDIAAALNVKFEDLIESE